MKLTKIRYSDLNGRQKENYNFTKVAALLADYGFQCLLLSDDWNGADFLALNNHEDVTHKVQLKGRLTIDTKYQGKDIVMAFPNDEHWYFVPHDDLMACVAANTPWLESSAWKNDGLYTSAKPSKALVGAIERYRL